MKTSSTLIGTALLLAAGVAAPRLLEAANVGSRNYTANWADAPKAQNYLLRNYEVTRIRPESGCRAITGRIRYESRL